MDTHAPTAQFPSQSIATAPHPDSTWVSPRLWSGTSTELRQEEGGCSPTIPGWPGSPEAAKLPGHTSQQPKLEIPTFPKAEISMRVGYSPCHLSPLLNPASALREECHIVLQLIQWIWMLQDSRTVGLLKCLEWLPWWQFFSLLQPGLLSIPM